MSDTQRKQLLSMARNLSPIDTIMRIGLMPRTVIPRILRHAVSWLVVGTYIGVATLARNNWALVFDDVDSDVMTRFDVCITSYEMLVACAEIFRSVERWAYVVVDEASLRRRRGSLTARGEERAHAL